MDFKGYFYIMSRQTGMVLTLSGDEPGTPIVVENLKSEKPEKQLWKYDSETGELESRLKEFRIDVSGGNAHNGAEIINSRANYAPSQKWYFKPDGAITFPDGSIHVPGGSIQVPDGIIQSGLGNMWVLDVAGASTNTGTQVILYQRHEGGPGINQQWDVVPYVPAEGFYIRSSHNDLYLTIKGGSNDPGAHLCIENKYDNPKVQQWKYNKDTRAIFSELHIHGYAVGISWQNTDERIYADVIIDNALQGRKQAWTFAKNGSIVNGVADGQWVLDVRGSRGAGTPVILYPWHGTANQKWYISTE